MGIIDRKYINDQDSSIHQKEMICYSVGSGDVHENGKFLTHGKKAEQGETVTMKVEGQTIYWFVGG